MTNFNNNPILLADATIMIVSILDSRFSIRRYLSAHASTCDSIFWFTEATVGFVGMCPPYYICVTDEPLVWLAALVDAAPLVQPVRFVPSTPV